MAAAVPLAPSLQRELSDEGRLLFSAGLACGRDHAAAAVVARAAAVDGSTDGQLDHDLQVFHGEYDDEGVYVYQAYNDEIADWAVAHQQFGGPKFNRTRMTWIKPSFAWVLYRAGYGRKHNQQRILKIKLSHEAIAHILSCCSTGHGGGGTVGRVQWDPARDLYEADVKKREPRKMLRQRAIQIGMKGSLSEYYVDHTITITDVTELAHRVEAAHMHKESALAKAAVESLLPDLPDERAYMPLCSHSVLVKLGMKEGDASRSLSRLGKGRADEAR